MIKSWDEAAPGATDQVGDGDDAVRDLKYAIRERLAVEHNVFADETGQSNVAIHNEGSARCTEDTYANIPANAAALAGREFFATDRGQLFVGAGSSWNSGPSIQHRYQQVYNSTGTVAVTNGSTAVTGTLTNFTDLGSGTTWLFRVSGERWYPVATVGGATSITLGIAYAGTTQTGVNYQFSNPADHPCYLPAYNASVQTMTITGGTLGGALAAGAYKITGLAAATVNGDALRYEHTTAATIDHPDASVTVAKMATSTGIAQLKISTYSGTGVAQSITGVGFQPTIAIVYGQNNSTNQQMTIKTSSDSGASSKMAGGPWITTAITSLDADGFTVGTSSHANTSGVTYTYIALKGL